MNNLGGALAFDAVINDANWNNTLTQMERRVLGLSDTTVRETNRIDAQFARLGQLAAGYFSFQALSQLPAQILKVRGEFQQLEIAFTTMLKSKTQADKLLGSLVEAAASTPFGLKDIASGAKQLLAYGSSAGSVVKEIRMLGDVASGVSAPINELIYLYGTLRSQGRAYAVDIRQFAGRGIPIYAELAKVLKVNVDQVNKFVEDGKVGFKEVEQAFKNMTSSGGLFAGLMDAQSKSLLGLKERLADAWDVMLNEIGQKNQDIAAGLLNTATEVVTHYQDVVDILKVAAATYGTYKTALLLVSVAQRAQTFLLQSIALEQGLAALSGEVLTAQQAKQIVVTKLLQRAQMELNATMLGNPYVVVATAVATLVAAYFVFRDTAIEVKTAQEFLAESSKASVANFRNQSQEVKSLIGVIQNQNIAESERLKAYEKVNSIAPELLRGLDFQKAKTADLTKELNLYLVSLEKKIRLESAQSALKSALEQDLEAAQNLQKAQDKLIETGKKKSRNNLLVPGVTTANGQVGALSNLDAANAELNQAVAVKKKTQAVVDQINGSITSIYTGGTKDAINAEIARLEQVQATIKDKLSPAYKQAEDDLKRLTAQRDALNKSEQTGQVVARKTVADYDAQIKALKEQQAASSSSRAEYVKYQKEIDTLTRQRNRLTGELTASEKKAAKEAEKSGPYGSFDYWNEISRKAQEILDKTPKTNTTEIAKQKAIIIDADRQAEAVRKAIAIQSFDEQLSEKKEKYALYEKWVLAYGKEAADTQFSELVRSGQSFVDYLNNQIDQLEAQKQNVGLTDKEALSLSSLLDTRSEATGQKSAIDLFRGKLEQAGQQAQSLTEYLAVLRAEQDKLNPADTSDLAIQKRLEISQQIAQSERERGGQLNSYLQQVVGSEEEALAISKKYANLRAEVEKKYLNNKGEDYRKALAGINRGEAEEVKELRERTTQASEAFKKLDNVILESGRAAMKKRLEALNKFLKEEIKAKETQAYQQKLKERNDLVVSISNDDLTRINEYGRLVGELGNSLSELGGIGGQIGGFFSGLASQISLATSAFKKNLEAADAVQIAIQGVVNIINIVTSASAQRKKAETDYYSAVIDQQQQYNLLLNEQIGLRTKASENIFIRDYSGELKDQFDKFDDAQKKYQESLKKLEQGRAKTGLNNAIDWGAVGSGAASGAGVGAAVGSIVPVIGTAIGAAVGAGVGALVGLFGGKKAQDEFGSLLEMYPKLITKTKDGVEELNVELAQTLIKENLVDEATKKALESTIEWKQQMEEAKQVVKDIAKELVGDVGNRLRDSLVNAFKEGTSAALEFKKTLEDVIESFVTQLLYSKVFTPLFNELTNDITDSLSPNGDQSITDDIAKFYQKAVPQINAYNELLKQAKDGAAAQGFDILKPSNSTTSTNSLSGAIKGIQEETASILSGQLNAIRITQADSNNIIRQQLLVLNNIQTNTALSAEYSKFLKSIDQRLETIASDPTRGIGGPK